MGAWIETVAGTPEKPCTFVAPYMGAWIETHQYLSFLSPNQSLPIWERGLKHQKYTAGCFSLPVAPYMGAWIETDRS